MTIYEIRVKGLLDPEWFDGLWITNAQSAEIVLSGVLADQAALHSVLNKVRDLRWARVLHEGIAGSELTVFGRSGHFPHLEEPESFSGAIREWLGRSAYP